MKKIFTLIYNCMSQVVDPLRAINGMKGFIWFIKDCQAYKRLPGAEHNRLLNLYPVLHDRRKTHEIDNHYFYLNAWAMSLILSNRPSIHLDIGSQTVFVGLLSAVVPTVFLEFRPLPVCLSGLLCLGGDIMDLPFKDNSIKSLSCLHVAEHIGLGRYGDHLDPYGTLKAARELKRVLAPGGNLFFAVPVGQPRLCFNAHRIHAAETICNYFDGLQLVEYSGVHDNGRYVEKVSLAEFQHSDYACGMFWFRKTI